MTEAAMERDEILIRIREYMVGLFDTMSRVRSELAGAERTGGE